MEEGRRMKQYTRMIRAEETIEESFDRNTKTLSLTERVERLTPKQIKVALLAVVDGKSIEKAVTFAANHPKR